MIIRVFLIIWLGAFSGVALGGDIPTARMDVEAPPSPAETLAKARQIRCGGGVGLLFPGLGQYCTGRNQEAVALASLTAAEIGGAVSVLALTEPPTNADPYGKPGRIVTVVAIQDLWVYSMGRQALDIQLARGSLYVPTDELPQMMAAPFNPRVLARPAVLGGILALGGSGIALQAALDPAPLLGARPNVFGWTPKPAVGYAATGVATGVLMEHVAIAEEIAFRGIVQSGLARSMGETPGWVTSSLIFGSIHGLNAVTLPEEDRIPYLLYAVPWITLTGSWLGLVYRWSDYGLTSPIAVHWWYNVIVSGAALATHPEDSLFKARVGFRW